MSETDLYKLLKKKVVIFDGAMGTALSDIPAKCCEELNLTNPDFIFRVHQSFIEAGSDVIETNTFNANKISLGEYGMERNVRQVNEKAVEIAKKAARFADHPVLISGSVGPTNKLPSMGQISYDLMWDAYYEQVLALFEADVDMIQIETCQDILQAKIPVAICNEIFKRKLRRIPIIVSVTVDSSGKMLLGTEPDAVLAVFVPMGVDVVALNCGVGPEGMSEAVRYLSHHSPVPILVQPNAGLPEIVAGKSNYNLSAEEFAKWMKYYVSEFNIEMVGGCCGTAPIHISSVFKAVGHLRPKERKVEWGPSVASLFNAVNLRQKPAPLIIGERMNVAGSRKFKQVILASDYDAAVNFAREQQDAGVHVLDVSVAYAGRTETRDLRGVVKLLINQVNLPISIDSTNVEVVEDALKIIPGRSLINSINLEDGGVKAKKILSFASKYSAAVIALVIDEHGMAKDVKKKLEVAGRIVKLCREHGFDESNLLIDLLTFTLAEPRAVEFGSGAKTLDAIKKLKKKYPKIGTVLGVSNISYGLDANARKILNSVFLYEALKVGLDAAIVHSSQIVPFSKIDEEIRKVALDLIWNRRKDALGAFINYFGYRELSFKEEMKVMAPSEGVRVSVLRGDKSGLKLHLDALLKEMEAKDILDNVLLPAMSEVGKMFDQGKIPLPFVLQSAEVMKLATDILAPHLKLDSAKAKGKVLLATVRGDVHDIGKNLVDIVISNNGFDVFNIGVKQPVENIYNEAVKNKVDVIGLSGLLVESALIMKDDLKDLARKGVQIPVICGGAALTKKYVEEELATVYNGRVYYAEDAFAGLKIIKKIITHAQ